MLMSDGPPHFCNETLGLFTPSLSTLNHFTVPYCPWSNGAVDILGHEILRVAQETIWEFKMPLNSWPDLLPHLKSAHNNSP